MVVIYTDGSCRYNPGPGAFAWARIEENDVTAYDSGPCGRVTNNQAEMIAVIEALTANNDLWLTIVSDSQIVVKGATKQWRRKKNLNLWKQIDELVHARSIKWEWVKGHSSDQWNNYVDNLAQEACPT